MEPNACIAGIDPGSKGAIAFLYPRQGKLAVYGLPVTKVVGSSRTFTYADGAGLAALCRLHAPVKAFLERVHSLPGDGAVGAFSFGDNFGTIKGVLGTLGIETYQIEPSVWKKTMKAPADKALSRKRANDLFPECVKLFTRADKAEAAMIALYGSLRTNWIFERIQPWKERNQ